jgi:hypothetical protein
MEDNERNGTISHEHGLWEEKGVNWGRGIG